MVDLEKSAAWYEELFELVPLFDEDGDERRAKIYRFPDVDAMIGLVEHRSNDGDGFRFDHTGLDHLAFTVATADEIAAWAQRLDAGGVTNSGVIDIPGGAILNFQDPDGIQLAFFWDDPEAPTE